MFQPLSFDDGMQPDATNPDVFFQILFFTTAGKM